MQVRYSLLGGLATLLDRWIVITPSDTNHKMMRADWVIPYPYQALSALLIDEDHANPLVRH